MCDPCAPKFILSCLTDEPTDSFLFNISGLTDGNVYYWRISDGNTVLTKAFTYVDGDPLEIPVSDVPEGFFQSKRTFQLEILDHPGDEQGVPFVICHHVRQISLDIECNIYPSNEAGL